MGCAQERTVLLSSYCGGLVLPQKREEEGESAAALVLEAEQTAVDSESLLNSS